MIDQAIFLALAAITLGSAFGVVTARSVFVSALWLILSFVGVAGLYVTLNAGFVAVIQLLIYVGAVSVLILFTIMLTRQVMASERLSNSQWYLAAGVGLAVFGLLAVLGFTTDWPLTGGQVLPANGGVVAIGAGGGAEASTEPARLPAEAVVKLDANGEVVEARIPGPTEALGRAFVTSYLLGFEVISAILLVALVGAVVIARE